MGRTPACEAGDPGSNSAVGRLIFLIKKGLGPTVLDENNWRKNSKRSRDPNLLKFPNNNKSILYSLHILKGILKSGMVIFIKFAANTLYFF